MPLHHRNVDGARGQKLRGLHRGDGKCGSARARLNLSLRSPFVAHFLWRFPADLVSRVVRAGLEIGDMMEHSMIRREDFDKARHPHPTRCVAVSSERPKLGRCALCTQRRICSTCRQWETAGAP